MAYEFLNVNALTTTIGAEVSGVSLSETLEQEVVEEIQRALHDRLVLYFPNQSIQAEELKRLLETFGELSVTRWAGKSSKTFGDDPYSHFLRNKDDESFEETTFTNRAHIDKAATKFLVKIIGLCALDVPDHGGDTVFTSLYAAYDGLSDPMQSYCNNLTGLFSPLRFGQVDAAVKAGPEAVAALKMSESAVERSLVHTHPETGRKALLVDNVWLWSIGNLHPEEGAAVLQYLRQHCARPEFQCRVRWATGGVAIWDNRCTSHFRVPDGFTGERVLQRASVLSHEETQLIRATSS